MNYILGNTLGGAGALNADRLALNLQFAADKSLKPRRGPTPTFSRASAATNVGPNGLIGYSENLAFYSQRFDTNKNLSGNIVFEGADVSIAPDGTLTADRIRFTGGTTGSILATSLGLFSGSKVITLWVKHVPTSDVIGAAFRLQFGNAVSSDFTATTQWQRFEFVTTDNSNSSLGIVAPSTGSTQTFDIWGIQYQRGTFSTEYLPTTSAAVYGARFDHDPVTLACRGLLIEEQRTNLILRSENFVDATWSKNGGSIASVSHTAPNGSANSDLYSEDAANSSHRTFQLFTGTIGTIYTLSVFAKAVGRQQIFLENRSISTNPYAIFDLQNGTIPNIVGAITASIQAYPNGWYRCSITGTANLAGGNYLIGGYLSGSQTYTGLNGPAFYLFGAQVEAGSFPTSYIPTTTATVARSADVCSITGSAFTGFYNNSAGTLVSEAMIANLIGNNRGIVQIDSGTTDNVIRHNYALADGGFITNLRANTDAVTSLNAVAGTASTIQKRAIAYEGTSFAGSTNGGSIATATRTFPVGLNTLRIGSLTAGTFVLNGHIASIRYYKKRLPNAKLQSLTT